MSRGINCPSAVPTPEMQKPKNCTLDSLHILPPSETTAAEPAGTACSGTKAIRPTATATAGAAFARASEPASLILAEAVEFVLALGARLLFSIGPRCIASRALPTAGAAWLLRGATERAG